jgi:hypothetical protein
MNKNWHIIIDGKGDHPEKGQVVVGYWISGPEKFAELCYYDPDDDEWVSCENGDGISEPDYWIESPE